MAGANGMHLAQECHSARCFCQQSACAFTNRVDAKLDYMWLVHFFLGANFLKIGKLKMLIRRLLQN